MADLTPIEKMIADADRARTEAHEAAHRKFATDAQELQAERDAAIQAAHEMYENADAETLAIFEQETAEARKKRDAAMLSHLKTFEAAVAEAKTKFIHAAAPYHDALDDELASADAAHAKAVRTAQRAAERNQ